MNTKYRPSQIRGALACMVAVILLASLSTVKVSAEDDRPKNNAPFFVIFPSYTSVKLGDKVGRSLIVRDKDGDTLTFNSVSNQLPGARLIEGKQGVATLEWTPTRKGVFYVDIIVTDDGVPPKSVQATVKIEVFEQTSGKITVSANSSQQRATVGDRITRQIDVTNQGPEIIDSLIVSITQSSGSSLTHVDAPCEEFAGTLRCNVDALAPAGSIGDARSITLSSQVNITTSQALTVAVDSTVDVPIAGSGQYVWTIPVDPIEQDRIQFEITGRESLTGDGGIADIPVVAVVEYPALEFNRALTGTVTGATDESGIVSMDLPGINFTDIQLSFPLTATSVLTVPQTLDVSLSINNMPVSGAMTTTTDSEAATAICQGIDLWTVDGSLQSGDCSGQSGHEWQGVTKASHATLTSQVLFRPPVRAAGQTQLQAEPVNVTIELAARLDPQVLLPLVVE